MCIWFFLNTVKNNFANISGIDINESAVKYAKDTLKLNVSSEDFLNVEKQKISNIDIFCMFDVIEHLVDPNKIINKINNESKIGSYIIITTGDISSFNARINGANWRLIHPPSHIHYFKKKTINKLLKKNNFEIISISYCGYYRNLSFILNKIEFIKKYLKIMIKILTYLRILKYDIYLNLFDIMLVIARKTK